MCLSSALFLVFTGGKLLDLAGYCHQSKDNILLGLTFEDRTDITSRNVYKCQLTQRNFAEKRKNISHLCAEKKKTNYRVIHKSLGNSELDCATTKTDTAERSISIGRESLQVFFVLGALTYFQVPPLGGSREKKWRSQ